MMLLRKIVSFAFVVTHFLFFSSAIMRVDNEEEIWFGIVLSRLINNMVLIVDGMRKCHGQCASYFSPATANKHLKQS